MRCSVLLCLACACLLDWAAAAKSASKIPAAAAPQSGFFGKLKTKLQGDPRVKRKELLKERHRRDWTLLEFVNGNAGDCEVRLKQNASRTQSCASTRVTHTSHIASALFVYMQFHQQMEVLIDRLENKVPVGVTKIVVGGSKDETTKLWKWLDDDRCGGLPFFYNVDTGEAICGATTWDNFLRW
jgi:hypothetical protein